MTSLAAAVANASPTVSFEFFPPSDPSTERTLWASLRQLAPLGPSFVSVTHGASGSTRDRTHAAVTRIATETDLTSVPHLTCVGARRESTVEVARRYWNAGIRHIVALRGDPPATEAGYVPTPGGFAYAVDLVAGLKRVADFEISVAGYPETHPEASSATADIANLQAKCDAGASRVITQFFFDADVFLRFRDRCRSAGISVPIVPGILPVNRFSQLQCFAARCGASIPQWLGRRFNGLDDNPEARKLVAASVAIELATRLEREGIEHFHFYTLNRADLTYAICLALGIGEQRSGAGRRPRAPIEARSKGC